MTGLLGCERLFDGERCEWTKWVYTPGPAEVSTQQATSARHANRRLCGQYNTVQCRDLRMGDGDTWGCHEPGPRAGRRIPGKLDAEGWPSAF